MTEAREAVVRITLNPAYSEKQAATWLPTMIGANLGGRPWIEGWTLEVNGEPVLDRPPGGG